jgi:outer membrane protein assembly factor BamB
LTSGKSACVWLFSILAAFPVTGYAADRARLEWPLGRGDIAGTGATATILPETLDLLWELPLGGLGFDATPVIGDNTIFIGDPDGRFFAIDFVTGKEKWQTKTEAGYIAPATYHEGIVYIGDYDGVLRALHAADGKEKWNYKCEMEIDASPTFFGENLLVTSQDGQLYCLKRETSELVWKYATGDQLRCGPSLAGNRTYLGGCDGKLHVIDVTTGMAIGQPIPLDGPTGSTPSVSGTSIFVPTHGGRVFAFDAATSKEIWQYFDPKVSQEFENCVATAENMVVATSKKSVFALDIQNGKEQWSTPVRKRSNSSPVIAGQDVVVSVDSRLMVLDLKTGKEKWQFEVKGSIGSPAVSDGKIVVASDKGTVFCFGQSPR